MLNSNVQEGQFYTQVRGRRNKKEFQNPQQNHPQQQQQRHYQNQPAAPAVPVPIGNETQGDVSSPGNQLNHLIPRSLGVGRHFSPYSNLARFLESTSPFVPAQCFAKTAVRGWSTCDVEYQHYFALSDLWASFSEWSAYGAGVPIAREGAEVTTQYYVPYLSGIQLYGVSAPVASANSRQTGENGDITESSGCEFEDVYYPDLQRHDHGVDKFPVAREWLSSFSQGNQSQEESSSDASDYGNLQGQLLFEYFESGSPYSREPLSEKIALLSCSYPGLNMLRSCDLLYPSWMSVAWYPIYKIPAGPVCRDLDACFLTYHPLSIPITGAETSPTLVYPSAIDGVPSFILPAFGMAFYKLGGPTWIQSGLSDYSEAYSLMLSAAQWVRALGVEHPDIEFFITRGSYHW